MSGVSTSAGLFALTLLIAPFSVGSVFNFLTNLIFSGSIYLTSFNPSSFTMMDYRLCYKNSCSFTYVLPFNETEALIEYTFFTPSLEGKESYNELLTTYIKDILKITKQNILHHPKKYNVKIRWRPMLVSI